MARICPNRFFFNFMISFHLKKIWCLDLYLYSWYGFCNKTMYLLIPQFFVLPCHPPLPPFLYYLFILTARLAALTITYIKMTSTHSHTHTHTHKHATINYTTHPCHKNIHSHLPMIQKINVCFWSIYFWLYIIQEFNF